jgi:AAA domain (dynein-related subfamily)
VACGSTPMGGESRYVETESAQHTIDGMLMLHTLDRDMCLMGSRGSGKTMLVQQFARLLDYATETFPLHQDMSHRDLLQRRATTSAGDTVWQPSPLVVAAREGRLAVLDNIDRLPPDLLSVVQSLVQDRELSLFDGSKLIPYERWLRLQNEEGMTLQQLSEVGFFDGQCVCVCGMCYMCVVCVCVCFVFFLLSRTLSAHNILNLRLFPVSVFVYVRGCLFIFMYMCVYVCVCTLCVMCVVCVCVCVCV